MGGRLFISSVRKTHPGGILQATARALLRYTPWSTEPGSSVGSAADEEEDNWRDWAGHARRAEGNSKHATATGIIRVEANLIVQWYRNGASVRSTAFALEVEILTPPCPSPAACSARSAALQ